MKHLIIFISVLAFCVGLVPHAYGIIAQAMRLQREGKTIILLGDMHLPHAKTAEEQVDLLASHLDRPTDNRLLLFERCPETGIDIHEQFMWQAWHTLQRQGHHVTSIECRNQTAEDFLYNPEVLNGPWNPKQISHIFDELDIAAHNVEQATADCPATAHLSSLFQHKQLPHLREQLVKMCALPIARRETNQELPGLLTQLDTTLSMLIEINTLKHILCAPEQNVYLLTGVAHAHAIVTLLEREGFVLQEKTRLSDVASKILAGKPISDSDAEEEEVYASRAELEAAEAAEYEAGIARSALDRGEFERFLANSHASLAKADAGTDKGTGRA